MSRGLDPEVRKLLDAALPALSPNEDAKARVRAHLTTLGPPGVEGQGDNEHDATSEKPRALGRLIRPGNVEISRWALGGLVAGGVVLGYVLGHQWAQPSVGQGLAPPGADRYAESTPWGQPSGARNPEPTGTASAEPHGDAASPGASVRLPTARELNGDEATRGDRARLEFADTQRAVPELASGGSHPSAPPASRDSVAPKGAAVVNAEDEVAWVLRAQKALARGEPQLALGLLRELDERLPKGRLGEERAACRAIARCTLEPAVRVTERATFSARYPRSIHGERVLRSCAKEE